MPKKYAIFLGCQIPVRLQSYEISARAVLSALEIELVDIRAFNCCGYPLRNISRTAFVLSSARNMALAEQRQLDMLALCQCGFGTFRMAAHLLARDRALKEEVNAVLAREGLRYEGKTQVQHLLGVLFHDLGLEGIRQKIVRTYDNLQIAVHHGCHALRPSKIVQFDDPVAPTIFDQLVEITGAQSIAWPARLDCCGGPLAGTNDSLSLDFAEKKIEEAQKAGAHFIATACPYCEIQFQTVPQRMTFERGLYQQVPSILYPQLLGPCLGIDQQGLGLDAGRSHITSFIKALAA